MFKARILEGVLVRITQGKEPTSFVCKFVPNPYQYTPNTIRRFDREGIALQVDISDYIGHYLYFGFKDPSQEALFSLCEPTFNVLDIGTNIGYSLLRLSGLASSGRVAGFEPDPVNHSACIKNLELNKHANNVRVYNMGLGESVMEAGIEVRTAGNRGANRIAVSTPGTGKISLSKLDTIFSELNWQRLDLVKIDVEGYELKVLKGGASVLKKFLPTLFIEVNDQNLRHQGDSADNLVSFILTLGYTHIRDAETNRLLSQNEDISGKHLDIIVTREAS